MIPPLAVQCKHGVVQFRYSLSYTQGYYPRCQKCDGPVDDAAAQTRNEQGSAEFLKTLGIPSRTPESPATPKEARDGR